MSRRRVVGYSVREVVDGQMIRYTGLDHRVSWRSYKEGDLDDETTRTGFRLWFDEYHKRVDNGNQVLRRTFGALRGLDPERPWEHSPVVKAYGAEPEKHEPDCGCWSCDDWERLPPGWNVVDSVKVVG